MPKRSHLYMAGRNDEAIAAYLRSLDIDPNFGLPTEIWELPTKSRQVSGRGPVVRDRIAAKSPRIDIYNDLANSYFRLNQRPQAIALEHGLELAQAAGDTENIKKVSAALQAKR